MEGMTRKCECGCGERVRTDKVRFRQGHYSRVGVCKPETPFQDSYVIDKRTECWNWTGALDEDGYGVKGKGFNRAHRWSYYLFRGHIPRNFEIDHSCLNHRCVNPEHLEAVPKLVNLQRQHSHLLETGTCKLVGETRQRMFKLYQSGKYTVDGLATIFSVSRGYIGELLSRNGIRKHTGKHARSSG
jgi:hypothetical protein